MTDLRFNPFDNGERQVGRQDEEWRRIGEDVGVRYSPMVFLGLACASGMAATFRWASRVIRAARRTTSFPSR